jgi:hypothetical protein
VALSLAGGSATEAATEAEAAPLLTPPSPATPVVAQLVPLQDSSLALVGTLLITTLPSPTSEANLGPAETEATAVSAQSVSSATPVSVGQGLTAENSHGDNAGGGDEPPARPEEPKDISNLPAAARWQRFILGTDEALERFGLDHPELLPPRPNDAPATNPTGGQESEIQAPVQQNTAPGQSTPTQGESRLDAIDRSIEALHDRRVGETHRKCNDMKIKLVGFTHPTITSEPSPEKRTDLSAALALAASVAGQLYFSTAKRSAKAGRRIAAASGRLGPRLDLDYEPGDSFQDPRRPSRLLEHAR